MLSPSGSRRDCLLVAASSCVLALALCACSPQKTPVTTSFEGAPSFTGPWAVEFTDALARSTDDFVRSVLADEVVTDQELSETRDRFSGCLSSFGVTDISFEADGGFSMRSPDSMSSDAVSERVDACSEESGENTVSALHSWVRRNPENLDEATILAACLVREGVVDPSFSAEDYTNADGDLPLLESVSAGLGQAAFMLCNNDPLGLFAPGSAPGA